MNRRPPGYEPGASATALPHASGCTRAEQKCGDRDRTGVLPVRNRARQPLRYPTAAGVPALRVAVRRGASPSSSSSGVIVTVRRHRQTSSSGVIVTVRRHRHRHRQASPSSSLTGVAPSRGPPRSGMSWSVRAMCSLCVICLAMSGWASKRLVYLSRYAALISSWSASRSAGTRPATTIRNVHDLRAAVSSVRGLHSDQVTSRLRRRCSLARRSWRRVATRFSVGPRARGGLPW